MSARVCASRDGFAGRNRPFADAWSRGRLGDRFWPRAKHPMKAYVALLRAVNVGGTGKLPMSTLKQMCEEVGLKQVRTHIASGNVVFKSDTEEAEIKSAIEGQLQA